MENFHSDKQEWLTKQESPIPSKEEFFCCCTFLYQFPANLALVLEVKVVAVTRIITVPLCRKRQS